MRRVFNIVSAISLALCIGLLGLYLLDDNGRAPHSIELVGTVRAGIWSRCLYLYNNDTPYFGQMMSMIPRPDLREFQFTLLGIRFSGLKWSTAGPLPSPTWWTLMVPLFYPAALTGILPLAWGLAAVSRQWHRRRDPNPNLCAKCGYDLRASNDRCPECGSPFQPVSAVRRAD